MKKIKIKDILVIIVLVISNLIIGSPLRYNIDIPCLVINFTALIYYIFWIKNKKEIELNRFDIFVIALAFSTFIPIIFHSYIRFKFTLEYVIRYISALNVYLIIKQYIKIDNKNINMITNAFIIMSEITVIFGIDMMTSKIFTFFYEFLKVPRIEHETTERMLSLFKYANSFCIYIGMALFVTLGAYLNCNNDTRLSKIKSALYTNAVFMQVFAIAITLSRLGWIIVFGMIVLYCIILKDKIKDILKVLIISGVNALIYFCLFDKILSKGLYFVTWSLFLIINIVQFTIFYNISFIENLLKKINKKIILVIIFVVVISFILLYFITPNELVLFNSKNSQTKYRQTNIVVEGDKEYEFKINLTTKTNKKENFRIYANEFDGNEQKIKENKNILKENFNGEFSFSIKTDSNTRYLSLVFLCVRPSEDSKMVVHSVKMNDKEIKIYYKLLPKSLINRIQKINLNSSSVNIRLDYIKQSIKIIKKNPLFGLGGYAWRGFIVESVELQSIAEHCYPLQLFMQNGIISIWIYLYIIFMIIENFIRNIKSNKKDFIKISFYVSLFVLILHSIFDFDMYFEVMLINMFVCFAIINDSERVKFKYRKIGYVLYGILICIILYFCIGEAIEMRFDIQNVKDDTQKLKILNTHIVLFPYDYQYYKEKLLVLYELKENGKNLSDVDIDSEIKKCIMFLENFEKLKMKE